MDFAEVLREHWPRYVEGATGPIPSRAWAFQLVFHTKERFSKTGRVHLSAYQQWV